MREAIVQNTKCGCAKSVGRPAKNGGRGVRGACPRRLALCQWRHSLSLRRERCGPEAGGLII